MDHPMLIGENIPPQTDPKAGRKLDNGKLQWNLLPWEAVREVVAVLTKGAIKYAPDNWKYVPDLRNRYFSALQRHVLAWWGGETNDPEWGLHHLAHAGCCLLFLLWLDLQPPPFAADGAKPSQL